MAGATRSDPWTADVGLDGTTALRRLPHGADVAQRSGADATWSGAGPGSTAAHGAGDVGATASPMVIGLRPGQRSPGALRRSRTSWFSNVFEPGPRCGSLGIRLARYLAYAFGRPTWPDLACRPALAGRGRRGPRGPPAPHGPLHAVFAAVGVAFVFRGDPRLDLGARLDLPRTQPGRDRRAHQTPPHLAAAGVAAELLAQARPRPARARVRHRPHARRRSDCRRTRCRTCPRSCGSSPTRTASAPAPCPPIRRAPCACSWFGSAAECFMLDQDTTWPAQLEPAAAGRPGDRAACPRRQRGPVADRLPSDRRRPRRRSPTLPLDRRDRPDGGRERPGLVARGSHPAGHRPGRRGPRQLLRGPPLRPVLGRSRAARSPAPRADSSRRLRGEDAAPEERGLVPRDAPRHAGRVPPRSSRRPRPCAAAPLLRGGPARAHQDLRPSRPSCRRGAPALAGSGLHPRGGSAALELRSGQPLPRGGGHLLRHRPRAGSHEPAGRGRGAGRRRGGGRSGRAPERCPQRLPALLRLPPLHAGWRRSGVAAPPRP